MLFFFVYFDQARYRMSKKSFTELAAKIKPYYYVHAPGPNSHTRTVQLEVALSATLRWLAGGSFLDICDIHCIRESTFYAVKTRVLNALAKGIGDEIRFPMTEHERRVVSDGFAKNSNGVLAGCLSAVDGWACAIRKPTLGRDCPNPSSYKNRKGFFAILVQAMCDADRLFTFIAVDSQGSCHDSTAFCQTSFYKNINTFVPKHYWIAGDDAYSCTEKLITPYAGRQERNSLQDNFNYLHSSGQRIYIE